MAIQGAGKDDGRRRQSREVGRKSKWQLGKHWRRWRSDAMGPRGCRGAGRAAWRGETTLQSLRARGSPGPSMRKPHQWNSLRDVREHRSHRSNVSHKKEECVRDSGLLRVRGVRPHPPALPMEGTSMYDLHQNWTHRSGMLGEKEAHAGPVQGCNTDSGEAPAASVTGRTNVVQLHLSRVRRAYPGPRPHRSGLPKSTVQKNHQGQQMWNRRSGTKKDALADLDQGVHPSRRTDRRSGGRRRATTTKGDPGSSGERDEAQEGSCRTRKNGRCRRCKGTKRNSNCESSNPNYRSQDKVLATRPRQCGRKQK